MRLRDRVKDRGSAVRIVAMISECELLVVETGLRMNVLVEVCIIDDGMWRSIECLVNLIL